MNSSFGLGVPAKSRDVGWSVFKQDDPLNHGWKMVVVDPACCKDGCETRVQFPSKL